jgi:hypothetical protein
MISDSGGMVSCFEAKTGNQIFSERLGGLQNHWISPICADDKIYFFSKDGISSVIEASSEFKILSKNESDTVFVSMPAIAGDTMLIRSNTHLYRIAKGYEVEPLPEIASRKKPKKFAKGTSQASKEKTQRSASAVLEVSAYYLGGETNSQGVFEANFLIEEKELPKDEWSRVKFTGDNFRDSFSSYKKYQKVNLDLAKRKVRRKK